jgi:hypothetical protein
MLVDIDIETDREPCKGTPTEQAKILGGLFKKTYGREVAYSRILGGYEKRSRSVLIVRGHWVSFQSMDEILDYLSKREDLPEKDKTELEALVKSWSSDGSIAASRA